MLPSSNKIIIYRCANDTIHMQWMILKKDIHSLRVMTFGIFRTHINFEELQFVSKKFTLLKSPPI